MIQFTYQKPIPVSFTLLHKQWLKEIIRRENRVPGDIVYFFCDDEYLHSQNVQFLQHDTLTDIITFDDGVGELVQGNIMISYDRVKDNALAFQVSEQEELLRVVAHGVLHLCGYKDKTDAEAQQMRRKEAEALMLFSEMLNHNNQ
ncbi:MAG: rRNA maturation RNase YbeY [Bacteroidales bacterium]|nr:rRNA maturation RNase YbeY [Bacteroidales bacterium]MBR0304684.1 rRNA maturation RNase YbeY [Bacteroidales bacterium]